MTTVSHRTKQSRMNALLASVRTQLISIVEQAGALKVQSGRSENPGNIEIDSQGNITFSGALADISEQTLEALSLADLAVLCEAAVEQLNKSDEERTAEQKNSAAHDLYLRRKNSVAFFAYDPEAWLRLHAIGTASPWQNADTDAWVCDVTVSRANNSGSIVCKLHAIFEAASATVVEAKLVYRTGETFYGVGAIPFSRKQELQEAGYSIHGPVDNVGWAFCIEGDYSEEFPSEDVAWAAASNDMSAMQN